MCEPCKPPEMHPHREVLAFDIASGDVRLVQVPDHALFLGPNAFCGAVALFCLCRLPVPSPAWRSLYHCRLPRHSHKPQVRSELNPIRQAARKVLHEIVGSFRAPATGHP